MCGCDVVLFTTGEKVRMVMPKLPASFTGTGDLFSASLLSWSDLELKVVCVCVCALPVGIGACIHSL